MQRAKASLKEDNSAGATSADQEEGGAASTDVTNASQVWGHSSLLAMNTCSAGAT